MFSLACISGTDEIETVKKEYFLDEETKEIYSSETPIIIKLNKSFSQKAAGKLLKFIDEHFEVEPKATQKR